MDDYDSGHNNDYEKVINIYDNSDIEEVITTIVTDEVPEHKMLRLEITKKAEGLRSALFVLDYRIITNIGARVFHCYELDDVWHTECYLVQVWRRRK